MTPEEAIAKSRELDRFLTKAKDELMPPITGAKSSMTSIKDMMKPVNDAMEEFRGNLKATVDQMAADVRSHGAMVINKVKSEHEDMKADFAEMLGNEHPDQVDDTGKSQG